MSMSLPGPSTQSTSQPPLSGDSGQQDVSQPGSIETYFLLEVRDLRDSVTHTPLSVTRSTRPDMDARGGIPNAPPPPPPPPPQSPSSRQVPDRYAPEAWLSHFNRYVTHRRMTEEEQLALFPLFLKGVTLDWHDNLVRACP